jgi:hypothetical protein
MSEFQSNSPFPTSKFNPLVRYGYLPVFPTMSSQSSRLLWFFLEGGPKAYKIDPVPISAYVDDLREAIKGRVKVLRDSDVDADSLELWKVVFLKFQGRAPSDFLFQLNRDVSVSPDRSLAQRLGALGDIHAYSTELSSAEKVGALFPEPHSEDDLHIVVRRPGEYCWIIVPYEQN